MHWIILFFIEIFDSILAGARKVLKHEGLVKCFKYGFIATITFCTIICMIVLIPIRIIFKIKL